MFQGKENLQNYFTRSHPAQPLVSLPSLLYLPRSALTWSSLSLPTPPQGATQSGMYALGRQGSQTEGHCVHICLFIMVFLSQVPIPVWLK